MTLNQSIHFIALFIILAALFLLLRFCNSFRKLEVGEVIPEEFSKKWMTQLKWMIALIVIGSVLGVVGITIE